MRTRSIFTRIDTHYPVQHNERLFFLYFEDNVSLNLNVIKFSFIASFYRERIKT